ncbi:MAG: histidine--tRNA ligase [Candidatus Terrybacteria bacterium]|nr:histidine--tRNA ligase [Candidatus Terrybacteria bacterium]
MKKDKAKLLLQAPKGMHDILPENYIFYQAVFDKAEEIASHYGFQFIQTPILENTDLFTASLGASTDIVEKQMYTLKTKGGGNLALRPEGTAPIMRSYIEHGMHTRPQPVMLWYKGSFFRHENPQKGRFREFQQFGLEIIGEPKPISETIIVRVLTLILEELGVGPIIVHINSLGDKECRSLYRKNLVNYYRKKTKDICKDCLRRLKENPLRLLDCKEQKCGEIKQAAPQMVDYLCPPCKEHFKEVLESFDSSEIPYFLDNHLVRGLDYYSRTVFEIFEDREERDDALASGGRYDYLARTLGRKDIPAVGGAIGVERVVQLMMDKKITPKQKKLPKIFFIHLGAAAKHKSLKIIEMLRKAHLAVNHSIGKDSLRGQLKLASKLNMSYALILGQKETLENSIIVRDMDSDNQETVKIDELVENIKNKLK